MSFDQWSHENNPIKMLHEWWNSQMYLDQRSHTPLPSATDTSLRADLSRIKFYRNKIVHCNSALVDDTDFESYWNDVTPVMHNNFTSV
jgi:hypothetical protein